MFISLTLQTPTLDSALLCSSKAGTDQGRRSGSEDGASPVWEREVDMDGIQTHRSRVTPLMKRALYLQATTAGSQQQLNWINFYEYLNCFFFKLFLDNTHETNQSNPIHFFGGDEKYSYEKLSDDSINTLTTALLTHQG